MEPSSPAEPVPSAPGAALPAQVALRAEHLLALRKALVAACTLSDLELLARVAFDVRLDEIVPIRDRMLTQIADDLVQWAAEQPAVGAHGLLDAALRQAPNNPDLLALQAAWRGLEFVTEYTCPYPGMKPFSREEQELFFGRTAETEEAIQRLQIDSTLVVIGPSGSGKSSLVLAGIVPTMQKLKVFGRPLAVRIVRPGATPLTAMAGAFGCPRHLAGDSTGAAPSGLVACIRQAVAAAPAVLVVDQLEEVFTLAPAADRMALGELLRALDDVDHLWVILTVRADFYPELMASDLWPEIERRRLEVVPLRGQALRAAIVQPAAHAGVTVDEALVQQLIADAAGEPGVLPFLQETLRLLWNHLDGRRLTLNAYREVAGQVAGQDEGRSALYVAMARHADDAYGRLDKGGQAIARRTFVRLVQFNEGRANTRRQLGEGELMAAEDDPATFAQVIALLVDRRLLTASSGAGGPERRLDISHEALLGGWPKLRQWLDEHRLDELVYRRLSGDAEAWEQNNRRSSYLYEGDRLREAERWAKDHADALGDLDLRFLHAGRIKQLRTRAAWAGAALAVLLLAAIAGLAYTGTLNRMLYRPPSPQWIVIPGNKFLMGSTTDEVAAADAMDAADLDNQPDVLGYDFSGEQPAHWVELSPYQIMRYEVTRAEYHQCQRAGVCDAVSPPLSVTGADGTLPVTGVSLEKAAGFCQFVGGSLPTEAQWELAARGAGTEHRFYPWGSEPDPARANVKSGALRPVGSYPGGDSEYGVADMAGNVWEWVNDFYAPYTALLPPGTNAGGDAGDSTISVDPTGPPSGNALVIRGGSFDNDWVKARSASRLGTIDLGRAAADIGFRCVRGGR